MEFVAHLTAGAPDGLDLNLQAGESYSDVTTEVAQFAPAPSLESCEAVLNTAQTAREGLDAALDVLRANEELVPELANRPFPSGPPPPMSGEHAAWASPANSIAREPT